ncbi:nucleotidyltransferase substrate binding protein [Salibacterium halotolerans]|uniref:Nucleotidyltransferase substrate binding protein, HI0074 family n=1 Tax=Salibacterium halotolerans TaxID=1884432 RepID=A0A1I5XMC8_9BACI|nr:nucleotidyltransferase substrate binding protein [Salibacterium halotolerans]SFQ33121.1 nucleotidyltransferase substrate binding protein, HI0074 family [Salibacterium halotolerans]
MRGEGVRWRQRFENFNKAYRTLMEAVEQYPVLSTLEKEGMIQRFEYTFELAWKTLKDYLESQGIDVTFPREVLKTAYQHDLIDNGEIWLEMLESRNILAHTYNEERFYLAVEKIKHDFSPAMTQTFQILKEKYDE